MKNLTLRNIAAVCRGQYHGPLEIQDQEVTAITTDSRKVEEGCLFVPIVGERVDAHKFIPQVMEQGALAVLSERELGQTDFPYIQIESSLQAVKDMAKFYLQQLQIPVVGVTGSVGKTSTKEAIAAVLSQKFRTLKTQGNFNNELGLPLTVFRLRGDEEIAVLEMGISDFGEMSRLARIARPDTCVITNIGPCHLEFLGDRDGVLKAKTEIFEYLKPDGTIILNGDDDKLITVQESHGRKPVFFGMDPGFPVHADQIESQGLKGMFCRIHMGPEAFDVLIPVPGRHMIYNALAAAAVGMTYGMTPSQIKAGIESLQPISGRFRMIETEKYLIVDDCYNANPVSVKASLDVLKDALGRKVAILGDMGELGDNAAALHEEVGAYAGGCSLDLLFCVGELSAHLAKAAKQANPKLRIVTADTVAQALELLPGLLEKGDTLLVKASHFMHFEQIVAALEEQK